MRTNLAIAALIYPMIQAVVFGAGFIALMIPPFRSEAMSLMPWMIGLTFLISVPIAAAMAPKLRSQRYRERHGEALAPR